MATAGTISCKQCGYENEPERVYCHNCGTKLDRALIPKEAAKPKESAEKSRRRLARMTRPATGFFLHWQKLLPQTIIAAILVASLIQAARPPAGAPAKPNREDLMNAQTLPEEIREQQAMPTPRQFAITDQMANLYLAKTIQSGEGGSQYARFDRAYVQFEQDRCRITAQESVFNYPVYASAWYALSISGNKLLATVVGGNIGRLPVHPLIMEYSTFAFQHLWEALQREHLLMDGMQSVTLRPGELVCVTRPGTGG